MLICSWNIFGIKAHREALTEAFHKLCPDVFCLVEVKTAEPMDDLQFEGYHRYWNSGQMPNQNGIAVYSKDEPLNVIRDIQEDGRILALEYASFYIVSTYVPYSNNKGGLAYRLEWNKYYQDFIHNLQHTKPVICCGDFNVVRSEADVWDGEINIRRGCFYREERMDFERLLTEEKLCDVYRQFNPQGTEYTYWPYSIRSAREENQGYRIDYFLVSESLMQKIGSMNIHKNIGGSCNCPISLEIK